MVSQCWSSARQVHVPPIVQSTKHAVIALVSWNWWWENSEIQTSSICFKHLHSTYRFFNLIFSLEEHTSSSIEGVPAVWTPIVANSITSHKMSRPLFFFFTRSIKVQLLYPICVWTLMFVLLIQGERTCSLNWTPIVANSRTKTGSRIMRNHLGPCVSRGLKPDRIDYDIFWPGAVAFPQTGWED